MCKYYNFKGDKCDLPALSNGFCSTHQYVAQDPDLQQTNEMRSITAKSKIKPPAHKIKAKLKPKPKPKSESVPDPKQTIKLKAKVKAKLRAKPKPRAKTLQPQQPQQPQQTEQQSEAKKLISKTHCEKWLKNPTINPLTGRMIKVNGSVYKKMQKACSFHGVNIPSPEGRFQDVYGCGNDMDPVMGDMYQDYEDYDDLIKLGSGMCYPLDTLYDWYKAKVTSSHEGTKFKVTDPMVPSYTLTDEELRQIDDYMSERDHSYQPPKQRPPIGPPQGYQLIIDQDWNNTVGFHNVRVRTPNGSNRIIGTLPMEVDEGGISSYAVLQKLYEAWNRSVLTLPGNPYHTVITMFEMTNTGLNNNYWWGGPPAYDPMSNPEYKEIIVKNLGIVEAQLEDLIN